MVFEKGSRRTRVPVRAATAFARAGATDGTETSPIPVGDSVGWIRWISISGTERMRTIAVEVPGDDLAALAERHLAPRRGTQPEQEPALDLRADQVRVDPDAAVEDVHDPFDVDAPARVERDL